MCSTVTVVEFEQRRHGLNRIGLNDGLVGPVSLHSGKTERRQFDVACAGEKQRVGQDADFF